MTTRALAFALWLGPLAWIADFAFSVALVPHVHASGSKAPLYAVSAGAALVTFGGMVASRVARKNAYATGSGERLLARVAPLANGFFLLVILAMLTVEILFSAGA